MNLKKLIIVITAIGALAILVTHMRKHKQAGQILVGILQTASHPALDAARDGFKQTLQEKLGDKVLFIEQNAQGSMVQAHAIAQSFAANKSIDIFFAIATPAAQSLSLVEKERPIFIAAVTDPQALGVIHPTTNVSGSSDQIDTEKEVEMLAALVPHAKTVALLFSTAESNSRCQVDKMKPALTKRGLKPIEVGFTHEADLPAALLSATKYDLILTPNDNTVSSAIALVASTALNHKKPLIVSDNLLVEHGALAARGIDYKKSGQQAGQKALEVLIDGKKPFELPVGIPEIDTVVINKKTLNTLGLSVPTLSDKIQFVGEQ